MKRKLAIAAGVAAAGVAILVAFLAWPRGADPVTETEAVAAFRSRTATIAATAASTVTPSPSLSATSLPADGVYSFDATGGEEVKLGPLPGETRSYPATVPVTIVRTGSCFTTTLNLIEQHTEDTTYCVGDDGTLRMQGHTKHQRVGAMSPTVEMTCDPGVLYQPGQSSRALQCSLAFSSGPAKMSAKAEGAAQASTVSVQVGNAARPATKLEVTYTFTGDINGTWTERTWFDADSWLPLRIERELDMKGFATFKESSTLALVSLEPRR